MDSIWSSVEFSSISRGFSYSEYVRFHDLYGIKGAKVCADVYSVLETAFNTSLEKASEPDTNEAPS
jgi:hypothetical protein